jgi:hypothetical protein
MAYDAEPGGDPRGPWCKGCGRPVGKDQPATHVHVEQDPDGRLGLSGLYHGECARPYWDRLTPLMKRLGWA